MIIMKTANIHDKSKVVGIIAKAFEDNPTLLFLIRNTKNKRYYLECIAGYAFEFAVRRHGVFLSDNDRGVAICFRYNYMKKDVRDLINLLKLILLAFSIRRILLIFYHNHYIEHIRPQDGNFLYFWFFGALPELQQGRSARDLSSEIFAMARKSGLDILAETTLKKNKTVYERYGFKTYLQWYNPYNKIHVYFMRKAYHDDHIMTPRRAHLCHGRCCR